MGCGWEVDGGGKTLHVLSVGAPGRPDGGRTGERDAAVICYASISARMPLRMYSRAE